jgi:Transglycosylase SLT domain
VRRLFLVALGLTILLPMLAVMLVFLAAAGESAAQCGIGLGAAGPVGGVPAADVPLFEGAAARFGLGARGPSVLAAINYVESTFGTSNLPGVHSGTNSAGAAGPMQFLAGTWAREAVNAPGDPPGQPPNIYDEADAVYSAAHYLHDSGAPADWPGAIFAYNHSSAYVQQVLSLAASYYTRGLSAQGSGTSTTTSPTGTASTAGPFSVPPASGDPAGPITLAPGQPTIVAATEFTDTTGAWGDNLLISHDSYAELSPGIPGPQVTRQNATMLGGLPYMTPLQVTNPQTGRSVILYKRDIGSGQPLSSTLDGYHYRIDLTAWAEQQIGLSGSELVQVTRLTGPVSTPGGGQACSASSPFAPAGSGIDPIPGFTIGRDDMGVDATAPVGAPIYAPFDSRLVEVVNGWYAGQPLLLFQFLHQPAGAPSDYWYVAEQITPVSTTVGTIFRARQAVARFAPSGTGIEIGWGSPTSTQRTLAGETDPGAANPPPGATTPWGESFKHFFGID